MIVLVENITFWKNLRKSRALLKNILKGVKGKKKEEKMAKIRIFSPNN